MSSGDIEMTRVRRNSTRIPLQDEFDDLSLPQLLRLCDQEYLRKHYFELAVMFDLLDLDKIFPHTIQNSDMRYYDIHNRNEILTLLDTYWSSGNRPSELLHFISNKLENFEVWFRQCGRIYLTSVLRVLRTDLTPFLTLSYLNSNHNENEFNLEKLILDVVVRYNRMRFNRINYTVAQYYEILNQDQQETGFPVLLLDDVEYPTSLAHYFKQEWYRGYEDPVLLHHLFDVKIKQQWNTFNTGLDYDTWSNQNRTLFFLGIAKAFWKIDQPLGYPSRESTSTRVRGGKTKRINPRRFRKSKRYQ
jgi:hypothetical protein